MEQVYISHGMLKMDQSDVVHRAIFAVFSRSHIISEVIRDFSIARDFELVSVGEATPVIELANRGKLNSTIAKLARSTHFLNPVNYEIESTTWLIGDSEDGKGSEPLAKFPLMLVFNAYENWSHYQESLAASQSIVHIASFKDTVRNRHYPGTVGLVFEAAGDDLENSIKRIRNGYVIGSLPSSLLDESGDCVLELMAMPGMTVTNPFDPAIALAGAENDPKAEPEGVWLFDIHDRRKILGKKSFEICVLVFGEDCKNGVPLRAERVLEIACYTSCCQIVDEGYRISSHLNGKSRKLAGVLDIDKFPTSELLCDAVLGSLLVSVRKAAVRFPGEITYDIVNILCAAYSGAASYDTVKSAMCRWEEFLNLEVQGPLTLSALSGLFFAECCGDLIQRR